MLGAILGPLAERYFTTTMIATDNDPSVFLTRPVSAVLVVVWVALVALLAFRAFRATPDHPGDTRSTSRATRPAPIPTPMRRTPVPDHSRRPAALAAALGVSLSLAGCGLVDGSDGSTGSLRASRRAGGARSAPAVAPTRWPARWRRPWPSPLDTDIPVVNVPGATGSTGMTEMLSSRPGEAMAVLIQDTLATVSAGGAAFEMDELRAVCRVQSMPSALLVRKDDLPGLGGPASPRRRTPPSR